MREIKFRAWVKEFDEMVYAEDSWDRFVFNSGGFRGFETDGEISDQTFIAPQSIELMQYTGLKDKNGEEIYEGDIVRENSTCHVGQVYLAQEGLGRWQIKTDWTDDLMYNTKELEIIGNIYENPELLKEKV